MASPRRRGRHQHRRDHELLAGTTGLPGRSGHGRKRSPDLKQEQFFIGAAKEQGRTWEIPLNANFAAPQIMKDARLDLGDYQELRAQAGEPLRINVGNNSHFIVNYDATLLEDILKEEANWMQSPSANYSRTCAS